jgi:hypothetical protein
MAVDSVRVGDRVRAYDYDCRDLSGRDACFTEGVVTGFVHEGGVDHGRYVISVERDVWAGKDMDVRRGGNVYPPVNGRIIYPANKFINLVEVLLTE